MGKALEANLEFLKTGHFQEYQVKNKADSAHAVLAWALFDKFDLIGSPDSSEIQMKRKSTTLFLCAIVFWGA